MPPAITPASRLLLASRESRRQLLDSKHDSLLMRIGIPKEQAAARQRLETILRDRCHRYARSCRTKRRLLVVYPLWQPPDKMHPCCWERDIQQMTQMRLQGRVHHIAPLTIHGEHAVMRS
jgi:hypothetical protein